MHIVQYFVVAEVFPFSLCYSPAHMSPYPFFLLLPHLILPLPPHSPQQSSAIAAQQSLLVAAVPAALTALSGPGPATDLADTVNAISQQNTIRQPLDYSHYLDSIQALLSAARSVQVQMGNLTVLGSASNQVRQQCYGSC